MRKQEGGAGGRRKERSMVAATRSACVRARA